MLFYGDSHFEAEVKYIEEHPKEVAALAGMTDEQKTRSHQLYSILTGLLKGKPLRVLRQVADRNGYEVLRQLVDLYTPSSRTRSIALLQAFLHFPSFVKERTMLEQILAMERLRAEYQQCSGKDVSDDLALSVLVKALPRKVREHIQLQMTDTTTYQEIRGKVLSYEMTTTTWSTSKVRAELGVIPSYPSLDTGGPMEEQGQREAWWQRTSERKRERWQRKGFTALEPKW